MSEKNPILYLLVRNDLASMNPGKAMAQVSHATNAMILGIANCSQNLRDLYATWMASTAQGFGTALVLEGNKQQIQDALDAAAWKSVNGWTIDPTYPYSANSELAGLIPTSLDTAPRRTFEKTTYLCRSEKTCAFIFGDKEELKPAVESLKLHP